MRQVTSTTSVVLLAAGRGERYTASGGVGHKLAAQFQGRALIEWAVSSALAAGVGPVSVVTGAVELPVPAGVRVLVNAYWEHGMATSLQVAIEAARRDGHQALVVGLADQPLVEPDAWRLVAQARSPVAVATYDGYRGHPVRLAAEVWRQMPATGDEGARSVLRQHPELVAEIPCPGTATDIDTVSDLQTLQTSRNR